MVDLVTKLPLLDATGIDVGGVADAMLALIHVEVESRTSVARFRRRFFRYHANLRQKYDLPVLPVAVFLHVGLDGLGVDVYRETYGPLEVVRFAYCYVGFPKLKAVEYLESDNEIALCLMGLMDVPEAESARLRAEAMKKILELVDDEFKRFLLSECLETYWTLTEEQQREYEELVEHPELAEVEAMAVTTFEKGQEAGERRLIRAMLSERFGKIPNSIIEHILSWPAEQLPQLALLAAQAQSPEELLSHSPAEEAAAGESSPTD